MEAYVIMVCPEASMSRISSEAYSDLIDAQDFVESRSGNIKKESDYIYRDEDDTIYLIYVVKVKERSY